MCCRLFIPSKMFFIFFISQINVLQSKRRSEILKSVHLFFFIINYNYCMSAFHIILKTRSCFFFLEDAVFHVCPLDVLPSRLRSLQWTAASYETAGWTGTLFIICYWIVFPVNGIYIFDSTLHKNVCFFDLLELGQIP